MRTSAALILVENVDGEPQARAVAGLASHLSDCSILITGRYTAIGQGGRWSRVPVKPFTPDKAFRQIQEELGEALSRYDAGELHGLVEVLGRLPLAIHVAAGHLRQPGMTVASFKQMLRTRVSMSSILSRPTTS